MRQFVIWLTAGAIAASVAACEQKPQQSLAERTSFAEAMKLADAKLAEKYARSCRACHTNPESGAPLAGDEDAWSPRLNQSEAVLLGHVRTGYKAMPASGQCFDCTDDDLEKLIAFMAKREGMQ